ncbi:HPP family protein [Halorientalis marina]|uniref:HPP family protein n=1 Tax=Halorientalis marina TaxID=2931976 RepID=UPI001FF1DD68|nr:HPP family protein [Halorientalis marina]
MLGGTRRRLVVLIGRLRRFQRRRVRAFRAWLEHTRNLLHLSVLLLMPLVLGLVTALSNAVQELPFLLFPPLASGAYTLFAQPESRYASPRRFVGGLTAGAVCGWLALELTAVLRYQPSSGGFSVDPFAVGLAVFLTGAVTWGLDMEEASAFAAALLVQVTDFTATSRWTYVVSVFLSSAIVAAIFVVWRSRFYERRDRYLYQSTNGDDHVLVPMRTEGADRTAMLGAHLAAAHDAGKVVLLDLVGDAETAAAESELLDRDADRLRAADGGEPTGSNTEGGDPEGSATADRPVSDAVTGDDGIAARARRLEERASDIETQVGVPCEVVIAVADGSPATTVIRTAHEVNCDLIAAPYEERHGSLSPFVRALFRGSTDVLVHRSAGDRTRWRRVMVPVRRAGDVAHAMVDFALRLTGRTGQVSVCNCIEPRRGRREAEEMLADLVEPFDGPIESRVARQPIESFLADHGPHYDLVFMGASMDRSAASRLVSPPTFERIQDIDCDVAIVDRNYE